MILSTRWFGKMISQLQFRRQSFIVRVWLEESERVSGEVTWRGHITHVPSGDSNHVNNLDEITSFIAKYLRQMGARVKLQRDICSWLRWLKRECPRTSDVKRKLQ